MQLSVAVEPLTKFGIVNTQLAPTFKFWLEGTPVITGLIASAIEIVCVSVLTNPHISVVVQVRVTV